MRTWMSKSIAVVTAALFVVAATSCRTTNQVYMPVEGQPGKAIEISGYATIDGQYHACDGHAILSQPPAATGLSPAQVTAQEEQHAACIAQRTEVIQRGQAIEDADQRIAVLKTAPDCSGYKPAARQTIRFQCGRNAPYKVSRAEVHAFYTEETNVPGVIGNVLLAGLIVLTVAFGVALATKSSCPFLYSWNGERWVFDGEPYGGATMKFLERTDFTQLESLVAVGGTYRVLMTNEVDETQHTDAIELVEIDHAPGTQVVFDHHGGIHAFRHTAPLVSARAGDGADLLPWLRATDRLAWYPDLPAVTSNLPLADTRDHITLELPRPPAGVGDVYLVTHVSTGLWGSKMLRTMMDLRGSSIDQFYAAANEMPIVQRKILEFNDREELFHLFVHVDVGGTWQRRGTIPGGGPFASESRAVKLDLTGVEGATVRLRIDPPVGFWSLNSFHLAWDETPARVTRKAPVRALDETGRDQRTALLADDDAYYDMPVTTNRAELVFEASPAVPGMQRSVFAQTRGWYELHLHNKTRAPDEAALAKLATEPGWIVQEAMREYVEFQRTGVLRGTDPVLANQPGPASFPPPAPRGTAAPAAIGTEAPASPSQAAP